MWVCLNNSFLSIVQHKDAPDLLMVRARFKGDLEAAFPGEAGEVVETPDADYLYRLTVPRDRVAYALTQAIGGINYTNFKGSVKQGWRHDLYLGLWGMLHFAQAAMLRICDKRGA